MSSLLRLAQTFRIPPSLRSLRTSRTPQPKPSNYFSPSHNPGSRFYSNNNMYYRNYNAYQSQVAANTRVLYSLMGINAAVFGYAIYTKTLASQGHPQKFISFMRNWTCNLTDVIRSGVYWQLMTSTFSHLDIWHIGGNMLTAYYLGGYLAASPLITPMRFLTISLGAGVMGSIGFLWQRYFVTGGKGVDYKRGLGFSGALMGITSVAACLAPTARVLIYGVIPMPLWGLVVGYAFFDGYYLNDGNSRVGHAGHLGGLAFGLGYYLLKLRGLRF